MNHPDLPPMLLDVSRLLWRAWRGQAMTGIDRACLAYVEHYQDRARAVVQRGGFTYVLGMEHSRRLFALLLDRPVGFRGRVVRLLVGSVFAHVAGLASLPGASYINVGHTGLDRPGHARWVRRTGVRAIYYVHDLIPISHPRFARAGEPERHARRMTTVLKCATGVIANSRDTVDALERFAGLHDLPMPPSHCAPLGLSKVQCAGDATRPYAKPYFIIVGTIEGRKNHLLLLNVWRDLVQRHGQNAPTLVIIGQRGWAAENVTHLLDNDAALRAHIVELGRCDDAQLGQYMMHAQALLFPSFVEGQGLPLIEALDAGTPVIASDLAVFRETAGNIPEYLDPHDKQIWADAVMEYSAADSVRRQAQIVRLEGFHAPDWSGHFAAVESWLRRYFS
ncbi:MAG: glycosyltransferase family 1 protein [Sphingobium sp.]